MTILLDRLGPRGRLWLHLLTSVGGTVICAVVLWQNLAVIADIVSRGTILQRGIPIPQIWVWWIIPYGVLLLVLQFLRMSFAAASDVVHGRWLPATTGGAAGI
jgi:TRAP-type C4-dicarboxylate transport system permease small subunit